MAQRAVHGLGPGLTVDERQYQDRLTEPPGRQPLGGLCQGHHGQQEPSCPGPDSDPDARAGRDTYTYTHTWTGRDAHADTWARSVHGAHTHR